MLEDGLKSVDMLIVDALLVAQTGGCDDIGCVVEH